MHIVHNSVLLLAAGAAALFGQRSYTATPVQAPGFVLSSLVWLSDDGKVGYGSGLTVTAAGTTSSQCFRYEEGAFTALPRGDLFCAPSSGNDKGQFVGVLASQAVMSAFLYDNRYLSFSRVLPGQPAMSVAQGINQRGDIAGFFYANPQNLTYTGADGHPASLIQYSNQYAFKLSGHQMTQLPTLGGPNTQAVAINSNGDAVGTSDLESGQTHAVLFPRGGGIVDLGTMGGNYSHGIAINSLGQVAGESTLSSDPRDLSYHAFLYDGSAMKPIPLPGVDSRAVSINDSGEVVGVYRDSNLVERPYYYANGTAVDLNFLVVNPPPGMVLSTPQYINNRGQILVMGVMGRSVLQFLLTPSN
jgi:probable HAF family extracellular repeat protein